ncbi:MAG: hypothetical protein ACTHMU_05415 [Thermomicrobiales bacterium]
MRCGAGTATVCPTTNASGIAEMIVGGASGLPSGNYPLIARYQGAANFAPELVTGTVTIVKADQIIVMFTNPGAKTYGDPPFTVSATATSGLTVSFSSLTTPVCTVSGTTVTVVSAGSCTIRASQADNSNYNAAPNVDHTFTVSATAASGLPVTFLASGVSSVNGATVTLTGDIGCERNVIHRQVW